MLCKISTTAKTKKTTTAVTKLLAMASAVVFCISLVNNSKADVGGVVINEIAWMGTEVSANDEWIELYNLGDEPVDLTGWVLAAADGTPSVTLEGEIAAGGYFLLERTDDESVPDVSANQIYTGALGNTGEMLELRDTDSALADSVDASAGWLAGDNTSKLTMERKSDGSWQNSQQTGGTPGAANSGEEESGGQEQEEESSETYSARIIINELFPNPDGKDDGEFIELYNSGDLEIPLAGWQLRDASKSGRFMFSEEHVIEPDDYLVIYKNDFSFSLNNSGGETVYLYTPDGTLIASASYQDSAPSGSVWAFDSGDGLWKWSRYPTPEKENKFRVAVPQGLILSEILPNPSGNEESGEFIELYNGSDLEVNLFGWTLRDASKSGNYIFNKDVFIGLSEYYVVYRREFRFGLNNSGDEKVFLIDPNGEIVDEVIFSGAREDVSYNFNSADGKWYWSRFLTPKQANQFNVLPRLKTKKPEECYRNVYCYFKVKVRDEDDNEIKVTWDFGDEHKSYKKETRHKYGENGKYLVSLAVRDGSDEVNEEFEVEVKNFPHPKVRLVRFSPNPSGRDSDNEWIEVKNKSNKKVDLGGWSIATGKDKDKLVNHPIGGSLEIRSGKTRRITRNDSKFTLANTETLIELRYPDGKVAHDVEYNKNKIEEDEIYEKTEGGSWRWVGAADNVQTNAELTQTDADSDANADNAEEADEERGTEENMDLADIGGMSRRPLAIDNWKWLAWGLDAEPQEALAQIAVVEMRGRVLGARTAREKQSFAARIGKGTWRWVNSGINTLLNGF